MRQRHNSNKDADKQKSEALTSSKSGSEHSPFCCSHKRIFLLCLAFRMVNSVLVQTYFNPDEHWQGPEVAHRVAFGYGHLTWEWKQGIRSYLHPLFFVPLYRLLALLHLDTPWLMMRAPRLLQSVFSAIGDLYLYKLSEVLFGDSVAKWTLFSQLFNWFMFYCFSRTLSNSLETVLTLVSLYFWPCMRSSSNYSFVSRKWGLVMAAVACAIRPTSAITWLYVGLLELLKARDRFKFIFLEVAPIGFVLPVLPIALMFSGYSLAAIEDPGSARYKGKESSKSHTRCPGKMKIAILFLLATNIPMALYMSLVHQRGPEDVMNHLAREALHGKVRSILFLTPCHATPYYSMLHHDLPMQFLDCTPSEEKGVPDDSDRFLMDPVSFVSEYAKNVSMASHIVLFDSEEQKLKNLLISFDYMEGRRFFNAHFKVDRDLQASVVVYVRRR
ncbi:GPI mannosyltransferase 3 isoform X2 [Vigna radiata var. radiata]|uniref:Mannosyltransferase n=1 Tax=Vigna radiata var. radiata TaxID=3916 RepID=A0A3Q0F6D7_VIGRR|nr:GPI mannosyltransferase 3 isoform X2 [Vigna radiata var. radiata]